MRQRGRGTRVVYKPSTPRLQAGVEGLMENLLNMGFSTTVRLLEFDYLSATLEVAAALGLAPGEQVQRSVRVRKLEGKAFSYLTAYVPRALGETYSRKDIASKPLLSLLEKNGVRVSRAEQTITACMADAVVSRAPGGRI